MEGLDSHFVWESGKGGGGVFCCVLNVLCIVFFLFCWVSHVYNCILFLMHSNTSPRGGGITFVSWNVRGLGHVLKRAKVFSHLKSLAADIVFLQETHIRPAGAKLLRCSWVNQIFQSTFSSNSRGVAILIRKTIPFRHISTLCDPNGRYILVTGHINSFHVTLLNIYGPNFDDPDFFSKLFNLIPSVADTHLLVGGDFNTVPDYFLDRSAQTSQPSSAASKVLQSLANSTNLVDIWRLQHPTGRDYSFFSQRHASFSRIDYFLLDSNLIGNVLSSKYHNILISDHAPVSLVLNLNHKQQHSSWRFHPSLLSDPSFEVFILSKISEFMDTNDNAEVTDSTLWETFKVVLRGHIISFESARKREKQKRLKDIESDLTKLEVSYKSDSSDSSVLQKILKLKFEYNNILSDQVKGQLLKLKQKYFELGDKPQRLLARQLRSLQADRAIYQIRSKTGEIITDPKCINESFKEYYRELYKSKAKGNIADWMARLDIPKLSNEDRDAIDADITIQEVLIAIKSFPNGKSAGPDGYGIELYKKYPGQFAPLLLRMLNHSFEAQKFPNSLYEANISLLLKEGRDEMDLTSFRPIALLNTDVKIFTKILANRLNNYITTIIHADQTGFIPGRFSFFNVRRLMNILYHKYEKGQEVAALCLDAQRAFDQIEYKYMWKVLELFGFGNKFISWVEILYAHPSSCILTNQDRSTPFSLHRGTRQGCPLSPLLFAIAIEPLAISIRQHPALKPIRLGNVDHHLSLYADDVAIFMSHPVQSVPILLELIKSFGEISGYTINWQKSEFMPLNEDLDANFLHNLPFKITDKFKYLGVVLPKDPKLVFKLNFLAKLDKMKEDIGRWRNLPISMIGRVNAIKMVSLPRFLYLFQSLPVFLTKAFFKTIDSIIIPFIWNFKSHRISKTHLHKSREKGGLGLPCFLHYYWAANLRALVYWQYGYSVEVSEETPAWVAIEKSSVTNGSLPALLFSAPGLPANTKLHNRMVLNSVKIWQQIRKNCKLPNTIIYTPVHLNHAFLPSLSDRVFDDWKKKGIATLKELYIDKQFASFSQLQEKFSIPSTHFFRYLQIRNYARQNISNFEQLPEEHRCCTLLLGRPDSKHLVSVFVKIFLEEFNVDTQFIKASWEAELGLQIDDITWDGGLSRIQACSVNARHQLIQFKVIHRLHYSKTKLHRIFPSISPLCDRCKSAEGSLSHLFWTCPKLHNFWCEIFKWFSDVYDTEFKPDPSIALFGYSLLLLDQSLSVENTLMYGMVIAKRLILRLWKSEAAPTFKDWLSELTGVLHLERLRYDLSNRLKIFYRIWQPILDHITQEDNDCSQE